jgi:NAD dependent epimerase/dehydratase family enzyme
MKVAITGATGFIGSRLVRKLHDRGDEIVIFVRDSSKAKRLFPESVYPRVAIVVYQATESGDWQSSIDGTDAVVNLAGEPISERWTTEYKQAILDSREIGTRKMVEAIAKAAVKPKVLIIGSAIGY